MTRREVLLSLSGLPALQLTAQPGLAQSADAGFAQGSVRQAAASRLAGARPDTFKVYTDAPRLLLPPQRLKLLRRERERRSLRWDQFETLWAANAPFPELGWVQALRFQIADDRDAGARAVAWAAGPADIQRLDDLRQIAIVADWCGSIMSPDDKRQIFGKLARGAAPAPKSLAGARARIFAAIALSEEQPGFAQKTLESFFDNFWNASLVASLREARAAIPNPDACALLEILHAFRDNLNFDLRDTFPAWFRQYPLLHLMAHYPAPWPAPENEFRIPAGQAIQQTGPDVRKAAMSRAAELAMVAYDANDSSSQFLQGWLTNDRFLMRGPFGIPYEFLWANPYQPGLSYYHVPLAFHDEIGGQLFVRSSWEDNAAWIGFFAGQLQLFKDGQVTRIDPASAREPLDIEAATVFFARAARKFRMQRTNAADVFIVGLDPKRPYHVEIDGEEMAEETADPGGIVYLPSVPPGGVRFAPRPPAG